MATKILTIDIERQSAIVQGIWQLKQQGYLRMNQVLVPTRTICVAWKWHGDPTMHFSSEWCPEGFDFTTPIPPREYKNTGLMEDYHVGRTAMLQQVHQALDEADFVIGWNSKSFDITNLRGEFADEGFGPPSPHHDIDLIKTSRSQFGFMSHRLNDAAEHFGVSNKADSFGLWEKLRWSRGNELTEARVKMQKYNEQDVLMTEQMFTEMLPWIPGLNLYGEGDYKADDWDDAEERCRRCNSTKIVWRGTRRAYSYWYKRFQCSDCKGWGRGTKNFYTSGTVSA